MALETANWVTQLVQTNPVDGDPVGEGDDHLRMVKTVLKIVFRLLLLRLLFLICQDNQENI